jgi:hypothetical protein
MPCRISLYAALMTTSYSSGVTSPHYHVLYSDMHLYLLINVKSGCMPSQTEVVAHRTSLSKVILSTVRNQFLK